VEVVVRFEIVRSSQGNQFFFRIVAGNGQTVATSETYAAKRSAVNTINSLRRRVADADVVDLTAGAAADKAATRTARTAAKNRPATKAT
jgi:uncharacterized protein